MFLLLVTLILNQVNASNPIPPKDGKYAYNKFGVEVEVQKGEPISVKLDEDNTALTKKDDLFYGEIKKDNKTISFTISTNDTRSLLVTIEEKNVLPKETENIVYKFQDLGVSLFIEKNLISTLYTGIGNKNNTTELKINENGTIASYTVYSQSPYTLIAENSQIKRFWCDDCDYKIGPAKNSILVSDNSYVTFSPNTIEMYSFDGIKKTINTKEGKYVNMSIIFYENSDLLSGSTQFNVEENSVIYKNSLNFITRKSF